MAISSSVLVREIIGKEHKKVLCYKAKILDENKDKNIVLFFVDTGERYLTTQMFSEE
jgi:hypothetical protein